MNKLDKIVDFFSKIVMGISVLILSIVTILQVIARFIFTKTGLNQKAPYLDIPMAVYYLSLPTAALTMVYFQFRKLCKEFLGGKKW